ncbi:MAG: tripartite tricarboxylate transporter permease [Pseudomonadota bacterium]
MDVLSSLMLGFSVVFQPTNLFFCFLGVLIGTMVGVVPGLGVACTFSLLLPVTFHMEPVAAIIMLGGIYYGAQYGGSTTSILVNIPGEATSVMTCLDGYQMALQGRAGPALGISAFGSFIAGTIGVVALMFLAPSLVGFAIKFGPPEYFSLVILGMTVLTFLTSTSMIRAMMMATFGLLLGTVGQDIISGITRLTFNIPELMDGIGIVPVVMGLFGISEVLLNVETKVKQRVFTGGKIKGFLPTLNDWKRSGGAIARGSVLGFLLGVLPGGGAVIASFASYAVEKMVSKHPENFGKGAIEGVAGPESANNAASSGAFVPLMTLGIPSNVPTAMLLAALIMYGITPGPLLLIQHPDIFWGVVASMYVGNVMLLVLNLPLIPLWIKLLKIPYTYLFPLIVLFCIIGAYSMNGSTFEVQIMLVFGIVGYLMRKLNLEIPPFVMALVLGQMLEKTFRQSLIMSGGSLTIFFTRPISATFIIIAILLYVLPSIPGLGLRRPGSVLPADDDD